MLAIPLFALQLSLASSVNKAIFDIWILLMVFGYMTKVFEVATTAVMVNRWSKQVFQWNQALIFDNFVFVSNR